MSDTVSVFDFVIIKSSNLDETLFNPIVNISLQQWSANSDGVPILSPDLMTEQEIDWHIEAFKKNLDVVGRKAKIALAKAKTHQ